MNLLDNDIVVDTDAEVRMIAFYLPQFYAFPENDKWWGKGFTEWTNVKKAKPLYSGHYQPTVPLNNNYYSLKSIDTMKWQVSLAKEYGVYGFCFYHYWFGDGRQLMEKPVDMFLEHKELDFPFCLSWANHNWTRTWVGGDKEILMDVKYGEKDEWEKHFEYLLPFFKDERYIRIDGKPVLIIYQPNAISCLEKMLEYFNEKAIDNDLKGVTFISQSMVLPQDKAMEYMDYCIEYEPNFSRFCVEQNLKLKAGRSFYLEKIDVILYHIKGILKKLSGNKIHRYRTYSYDKLWDYIIRREKFNDKMIAGAFVKCDVTPRRQDRALIYKGASPKKFECNLKRLIGKVKNNYKLPIIFLSAWNEWGEGMYLEPDEKFKYAYLEALMTALKDEEC